MPVLAEIPKPKTRAGQVLIKVKAAGMSRMNQCAARGGYGDRIRAKFPMVLGADFADTVENAGDGVTAFSRGDEIFGQLVIAPLGSSGTYAEYVAISDKAPIAKVPDGMEAVVAAAVPTPGMTALSLIESLEPISGKTVLIVGAAHCVGSFATQFAARAGANVIANARAASAARMRSYGAAETIDDSSGPIATQVRRSYPGGIDVLIDLASDAETFAALACLVNPGGTALSTRFVADARALVVTGVTAINFALESSSKLLCRVADALVKRSIVPPPITRITLDEAPAAFIGTIQRPIDGKPVIAFGNG